MDVKGLAAVVTGGASGLGAATVRLLAARGARVAVFDLQEEKGQAVAAEVGGIFARCNVADEASASAAFAAARAAHGPVRVLINCAGIGGAVRTTSKGQPYPLDQFTRIINVNLIGTFNCIRLAATEMAAAEPLDDGHRGAIVNTASVAAFDGQIGQAAYSASKAGVVGMTLPIARDLSREGIRVNTIAPGLFLTPLLEGLSEENRKSLGAQVPFPPRLGRPEEFAHMAVALVENNMMNGETIRLDGAIRMAPK